MIQKVIEKVKSHHVHLSITFLNIVLLAVCVLSPITIMKSFHAINNKEERIMQLEKENNVLHSINDRQRQILDQWDSCELCKTQCLKN